jgi:hypothetical protein
MDIKSTTEEMVPIIINPTTKAGKPAELDGPATLSIVSGGATVRQATDEEIQGTPGLIGFVVSEDTAGVSVFQVSADADLGEGVATITDGGSYTYNSPLAENLGLTNGVAVPKA